MSPAAGAGPAAFRPPRASRRNGGIWLAARCAAALVLGARPLPGGGRGGDLLATCAVTWSWPPGTRPEVSGRPRPAAGTAPDAPIDAEPIMQNPGQDRVAAAGGETLQLTVPGKLQREDISFEGRDGGVAELDPGHLAHLPNRIEDAVPAAAERCGVDDAGGSRGLGPGGGLAAGPTVARGGGCADEARASEAEDVACLAGAGADGVCQAWAVCPRSFCPSSSCPGWACPAGPVPARPARTGSCAGALNADPACAAGLDADRAGAERSRGSWYGGLGWCPPTLPRASRRSIRSSLASSAASSASAAGSSIRAQVNSSSNLRRRRAAHFGQTRIEYLSRPGQLSVTEPGYLLAQVVHLVRRAVEQARAVGPDQRAEHDEVAEPVK